MAKMSSYGIAMSGLGAAQAGIYVLGHNISNVDTTGYTRQQVVQQDFLSSTVGRNATGALQVGLGTDVAAIRQIRNKWLDLSYREEVPKLGFYSTKYDIGTKIETIIGEMEGQYKFQDVLGNLWNTLHELSVFPDGIETRGMLLSNATVFVDKVNNVANRLRYEQDILNNQIITTTQQINGLLNKINSLNSQIVSAEAMGDNANDYRDTRNNALDDLSYLLNITYKEQPNGAVIVMTEGKDLVNNGIIAHIGLRYTSEVCDFVEPVITNSTEILPYDPTNSNGRPLVSFSKSITVENGNDSGALKAMLLARGFRPANYAMTPDTIKSLIAQSEADLSALKSGGTATKAQINEAEKKLAGYKQDLFNVTECLIPKTQMEFDTLVHAVVTMINDVVSPYDQVTKTKDTDNAPYDMNGNQSFEAIFVRDKTRYRDRFNGDNLVDETAYGDGYDYYTLYTMGNIIVNPNILGAENYDKISLSYSGAVGEQTALIQMLEYWESGWSSNIAIDKEEAKGVNSFYNQFIDRLAVETSEAYSYVKNQTDLVVGIDGKRQQVMGVSMDEEMTNMLRYQHAYNASARMLNVIDSLVDKIVNGTGRVGL